MMPTSCHAPIAVFACRWCALLGAERAGRERLPLPPEIRLFPVPCAGSVSHDAILTAFANGAVGVAVLGCHMGGCRHNEANVSASARLTLLADTFEAVGIDPRRLAVSWGTVHEAKAYAKFLQALAQTLETLPPLPDFFAKDLKVSPLALHPELEDSDQDETLRLQAAKALADGNVVLGLARVGTNTIPTLFTQEQDVPQLVAGPKYPLAKLAGTLISERANAQLSPTGAQQSLREQALSLKERALTIVCRACDARALFSLASLHRFASADLRFIPIACSTEQIHACSCSCSEWPGETRCEEREARKESRAEKEDALPTFQPEAVLDNQAFWQQHFSRCMLCYSCRTACPVCICPKCALEQQSHFPTGRAVQSTLLYHVARALHVADVCVQCGACEQACPRQLPLLTLHQSVARGLSRMGYTAASHTPSPLRRLRKPSDEPQWFDSHKEGRL